MGGMMNSGGDHPVDQSRQSIHVVVVELHHHSDLIRNVISVLELERFTMSLITVPGVYEKVGVAWEEKADWLSVSCKPPEESMAGFIERMRPVFESADILYFNTVRHYWAELCQIPFSSPSIIRVHNAHADLAPASHFYRPFIKFPAILSHLIRKVWIAGEWRQREQLFSHIDYFMFPNQTITDYVSERRWLSPQKILPPILPFGFLGEPTVSDTNIDAKIVTIAITGKVTNAKKDYRLVYLALKQCIDQLRFPLRLVLLGKAANKQAKQIVADFKTLESERFSLDYSDDYVSPDEFENKVASVDFLLAPIKIQTHFRKYGEVYGKSKMSGIENDILMHRKPSLVTAQYRIKGDIDKAVEYFEPTPESIAASMTAWVNQKKYDDLGSHFDEMSRYCPETVAKDFYRLCEKLVRGLPVEREH